MSADAPTAVLPPFCNPDGPHQKYEDYPRDFDMVDTPEQLAWWPLLRRRLEVCEREILPVYHRADTAALRHQDRHRKLANAAALLGTAAVLLAIFQLAIFKPAEPSGHGAVLVRETSSPRRAPDRGDAETGRGPVLILETLSALGALAAVVLGLLIAIKARWLLERHKAERLRLLKFRFLLDPELWSDDDRFAGRVQKLRDSLQEVRRMSAHDFREWVEELGKIAMPRPAQPCLAGPEAFAQLVDYYRAKRLVFQREYFEDRTIRNVPWAGLTGWLAPVLFFSSVAFVLLHFVADEMFPHGRAVDRAGRLFIFLAAALPAVGAGIRTFTAANEFARNKVRYRAKEAVLNHVDAHLKETKDTGARLLDMEFCEQVLELEHREWARLMSETEVFP